MAATTLDKISHDHNTDARRYVASLIAMGATRGQVVEKLRERFGVTISKRSVTAWRNNDDALIAQVEELAAAKADLDPADPRNPADLLPEPVDPCEVADAIYALHDEHPAWSRLSHRAQHDPDMDDDLAWNLLLEDHADDAAFEAACASAADGWDPAGYEVARHYAKQSYPTPERYAAYDRYFV